MTLHILRSDRKSIIGIFKSEDDAMKSAQDAGGIVPAAADKGSRPFGVLAPRWSIERLEPKPIQERIDADQAERKEQLRLRHRESLVAALDACDLTAPAGQDKYSQGWIACREKCRAAILALIEAS